MATVLIQPVATKTRGGYDAQVIGIELTDYDCLEGTIDTPAMGRINARWNVLGICRDNPEGFNLDIRSPEVADVMETAKKLGCKI